ncbi:NUDIX domain-containing protein, partial [Cryobacterium sp. MLB-32]
MRRIDKAAAVILRGGLLLVVRKRGSTTFISPGGKPEPGERMDQALAREL